MNHFRESINNSEYSGVTLRERQAGDKMEGYVRPGKVRNGQGVEEERRGVVWRFYSGSTQDRLLHTRLCCGRRRATKTSVGPQTWFWQPRDGMTAWRRDTTRGLWVARSQEHRTFRMDRLKGQVRLPGCPGPFVLCPAGPLSNVLMEEG